MHIYTYNALYMRTRTYKCGINWFLAFKANKLPMATADQGLKILEDDSKQAKTPPPHGPRACTM